MKDKGLFNLDFENTVLMLSRYNKLREHIRQMALIAIKLITRPNMQEVDKIELRKMLDLASKKDD